MRFENLYYPEMTGETFKELENIGRWFNTIYGTYPTIIGGWAVWFYNPAGMGSRDIDILFGSREMKDRLVNQYLICNNFKCKKRSLFEVEYIKEVKTSKGIEDIYIDACSAEDGNLVHGVGIEVPWSLALKNAKLVTHGKLNFYIPVPEVLIVFKAKAAYDREYDSKHAFDPFYIQSKIWKDYYDITSLLKYCEFEPALIRKILGGTGFTKFFLEVVERLVDKKDILERHGISREFSKSRIETLGITRDQ